MSNSILELETDGTYDLDKIEVLNEFGGVEETKEEVPISYGVEESKEMSAPPLESAAKHTYDKGYARWERFDVETELKKEEASPRPAAKKKKKRQHQQKIKKRNRTRLILVYQCLKSSKHHKKMESMQS
mmetsp:Transcript_17494/g.21450  ORF Transcript_17494/g.21450 Transcript_17494/m.21450 type:complete len:129 (+) Transcript_17494:64-450(+)